MQRPAASENLTTQVLHVDFTRSGWFWKWARECRWWPLRERRRRPIAAGDGRRGHAVWAMSGDCPYERAAGCMSESALKDADYSDNISLFHAPNVIHDQSKNMFTKSGSTKGTGRSFPRPSSVLVDVGIKRTRQRSKKPEPSTAEIDGLEW